MKKPTDRDLSIWLVPDVDCIILFIAGYKIWGEAQPERCPCHCRMPDHFGSTTRLVVERVKRRLRLLILVTLSRSAFSQGGPWLYDRAADRLGPLLQCIHRIKRSGGSAGFIAVGCTLRCTVTGRLQRSSTLVLTLPIRSLFRPVRPWDPITTWSTARSSAA